MICMSCTPPLTEAGHPPFARPFTPAGCIAGTIGCAWRAYWTRRARHAIVLLLRALGEDGLRELGIAPDEIECPNRAPQSIAMRARGD